MHLRKYPIGMHHNLFWQLLCRRYWKIAETCRISLPNSKWPIPFPSPMNKAWFFQLNAEIWFIISNCTHESLSANPADSFSPIMWFNLVLYIEMLHVSASSNHTSAALNTKGFLVNDTGKVWSLLLNIDIDKWVLLHRMLCYTVLCSAGGHNFYILQHKEWKEG